MNNSFFKTAVARWRKEMSPKFIEALNTARVDPGDSSRITDILAGLAKQRRGHGMSPQEATMFRTKINPPIPESALPFKGKGHPAFKGFEETVKKIQSKFSPSSPPSSGRATFDTKKLKTPLAIAGGLAALSALGIGTAHLIGRKRAKKLEGEKLTN